MKRKIVLCLLIAFLALSVLLAGCNYFPRTVQEECMNNGGNWSNGKCTYSTQPATDDSSEIPMPEIKEESNGIANLPI